jgi:hypothetical protein
VWLVFVHSGIKNDLLYLCHIVLSLKACTFVVMEMFLCVSTYLCIIVLTIIVVNNYRFIKFYVVIINEYV